MPSEVTWLFLPDFFLKWTHLSHEQGQRICHHSTRGWSTAEPCTGKLFHTRPDPVVRPRKVRVPVPVPGTFFPYPRGTRGFFFELELGLTCLHCRNSTQCLVWERASVPIEYSATEAAKPDNPLPPGCVKLGYFAYSGVLTPNRHSNLPQFKIAWNT
jgi:hypothetical protein